MNTAMWEHPLTDKHLTVLRDELCATIIPPKGSSTLACGDVGGGAMHAVDGIVQAVQAVADVHAAEGVGGGAAALAAAE